MLARAQDIHVELLVQVVRHGAVDRLDLALGQQVVIVGEGPHAGQRAREPVIASGLASQTATICGRTPMSSRWHPARGGAGELAAHQSAADDAELAGCAAPSCAASVKIFAACSGVAPSWTIAISARVMPAGLRAASRCARRRCPRAPCCITLVRARRISSSARARRRAPAPARRRRSR